MKKPIIKIILLVLTISVVVWSKGGFREKVLGITAQAVGDLTVEWGVPSGQPIFVVKNFLPGETTERQVKIFNGASVIKPVGIVGVKTEELKDLANVLEIEISQNGTDLYGGSLGSKTLEQFFQDSTIPNAIFLFNLNPGDTKSIKFAVKFQQGADNAYQGAKVVFDILIGLYYQVPEECRGIKFSRPPIFGTQRSDILRGTNGNDLIFGFEGNDRIDSSNGDDCLVGGPGNDRIFGSNGNDVILGSEGDDYLDGSNGNDRIFGG